MIIESLAVAAPLVLAGVIWGVRQEGRITTASATLDQKVSDNDKLQTQRVDSLKELIESKFDGMDDRLARIERGMNGYLRGGGHA